MNTTYIESLQWRYATKKFDTTKKIASEDINTLKEIIRLSASSYGLQPYRVLIIENTDIRKQLQSVSWRQSQIVDASHLLIFCNEIDVNDDFINNYLDIVSNTRNIDKEELKGYGDFMKSKITPLSSDIKNNWTSRQAYIALGNLLSGAAELRIDTCPIEGFEPDQYDTILGLKDKGLTPSVVVALGYRSKEDHTQQLAKVRKSNEDLFTTI